MVGVFLGGVATRPPSVGGPRSAVYLVRVPPPSLMVRGRHSVGVTPRGGATPPQSVGAIGGRGRHSVKLNPKPQNPKTLNPKP